MTVLLFRTKSSGARDARPAGGVSSGSRGDVLVLVSFGEVFVDVNSLEPFVRWFDVRSARSAHGISQHC